MKFKWWGHSCFTITTEGETKIVTDPYAEDFSYKSIEDEADLVTVSHDHFDHNGVENVAGDFEVVNTVEGYSDSEVEITGVSSYHDDAHGGKRGENIIFIIKAENKTVCHFGDLGHPLTDSQKDQLQGIDIVLIPVGGNFTINDHQAYAIVQELEPVVVIPMHYQTDKIDLPINGVEKFLKKFNSNQVKNMQQPEVEIKELPGARTVYVLDYK